jgi:hypothetical protein
MPQALLDGEFPDRRESQPREVTTPDSFILNRNGKPHEKADPAVVHTLRQILEPARTEAEHASELLEDEDTTWFGFGRDSSGQSMFYDYGRFSAIMSELVSNGSSDIYPQLVSVIGETGELGL